MGSGLGLADRSCRKSRDRGVATPWSARAPTGGGVASAPLSYEQEGSKLACTNPGNYEHSVHASARNAVVPRVSKL